MRHAWKFIVDPVTGKAYPIPAGGADDGDPGDDGDGQDDQDGTDSTDDDTSDVDEDDKPLGPEGEKALRAMKKRAREAEKELRRLKAEAARQATGQQDDDAPDPDELRRQLETEIRAEAARERALDKLEAKAARRFQNPDLARKLLADQADSFLDEQGNPDVEAITEALDELLEEEPYLAVQDGQRFQGDADGGARNGTKPTQLTRADLAQMSPEQISKAKAEGRLDRLLGRM